MNAICLGGPCHGLLTHTDQEVGTLVIPVPRRSPSEPGSCARYLITKERMRYAGQAEPYIALHWADAPAPPCACEP
ncbi:hypothetical protein [Nonomuraea sp. NPDC003804]|uniref:hypothetical protein n=1 Tax=Nonomuraea sp. NPDC003804 TaxID=3154547 RepID=UPI0033A77B1B